ncbi:hypothetical protein ACPCTO_03265 [Streptomyces olivoreticuli]
MVALSRVTSFEGDQMPQLWTVIAPGGQEVVNLDSLQHLNFVGFPSPAVGGLATNWASGTLARGCDVAGTVQATTGATAPGAGNVCAVTFANPYTNLPQAVLVNGPLDGYAASVTINGFTIAVNDAPAVSTTYNFAFIVIGSDS